MRERSEPTTRAERAPAVRVAHGNSARSAQTRLVKNKNSKKKQRRANGKAPAGQSLGVTK